MPSAIDIQHLNFSFGEGELRKQVLYDVSFQVEAGTVVILMGPSGCGKTTLLTLVGGLRSLQDGEVNILGHRLHHASQPELVAVRRHIGFVFQLHNLLDFLTAQQNVEMSLQLHPEVDPPTRRHRNAESRRSRRALGLLPRGLIGWTTAASLHCPRAGGTTAIDSRR
jgi:putative ABC transport system ATP-binding protein